MPTVNQRIGEYVLDSRVGVGTFGEVWKAHHHVWADQLAAVKIPTDPAYVLNLQKEGTNVHALVQGSNHPNIVRAIGFDPYADPPYLTMEYVPGSSLRPYIQQRKLTPMQGVAALRQVLAGLEHAHRNGVIHRDVKPENILVHERALKDGFDAEGVVKVTDFGLGKAAAAMAATSIAYSASMNNANGKNLANIAGTIDYMAPEQRSGAEIDGRADLYACGVILYEILTGERPAGAGLPSELNPAAPKYLDEVFRRSYARLDKRYATAGEFAEALMPISTRDERPATVQVDAEPAARRILSVVEEQTNKLADYDQEIAEALEDYLPTSDHVRRLQQRRNDYFIQVRPSLLEQLCVHQAELASLEAQMRPTAAPVAVKRAEVDRLRGLCNPTLVSSIIGVKFAPIPAGWFMMGSFAHEAGREDDEGPQHRVRITKPFYIGVASVTQAQWKVLMGNNPSQFQGDDLPVERVSWDDAAAFCQKLSAKEGQKYRLPTEAEWEYACRVGTTTAYYTGNDESALREAGWYGGNSDQKTHPVCQKKPNAWGLYDMHGNVFQWCNDWYDRRYYSQSPEDDPPGPGRSSEHPACRVLRGGSWVLNARRCRSAARNWNASDYRHLGVGFRLALDSQ